MAGMAVPAGQADPAILYGTSRIPPMGIHYRHLTGALLYDLVDPLAPYIPHDRE